jgi:hypothetical protein
LNHHRGQEGGQREGPPPGLQCATTGSASHADDDTTPVLLQWALTSPPTGVLPWPIT